MRTGDDRGERSAGSRPVTCAATAGFETQIDANQGVSREWLDADVLDANIQSAERTLHAGDCRARLTIVGTSASGSWHFDLMEEREQPTDTENRRLVRGRSTWIRANHITGLVALGAILLVALGVGTARRSQGSMPEVSLGGSGGRPVGDSPLTAAHGGAGSPSGSPSDIPLRAVGVASGSDARTPGLAAPAGSRRLLASGLLSGLVPERFGRSLPDDRPIPSTDAPNMRTYNGRPIRLVTVLRMRVTAYSPDERSCGASADGITASGYSVLTNGGFLVAADPRVLPLGSLVRVPGYDDGAVVPVLDTGGAIKGDRLDVLYPTHELAVEWGVQELEVEVWDYADGMPSGFRRVRRAAK